FPAHAALTASMGWKWRQPASCIPPASTCILLHPPGAACVAPCVAACFARGSVARVPAGAVRLGHRTAAEGGGADGRHGAGGVRAFGRTGAVFWSRLLGPSGRWRRTCCAAPAPAPHSRAPPLAPLQTRCDPTRARHQLPLGWAGVAGRGSRVAVCRD